MRFPGFIGPSYILDSVNVDCQRTVNLYPVLNEIGKGKEGEVAYLKGTPGLLKLFNSGAGPIRMIHTDPVGRVFIASGNKMIKATWNGSVWSQTEIGTLMTSSGPVRASSAAHDSDGFGFTTFVDGDTCYLFWAYDDSGPTESFGTYGSFGYAPADLASYVELDNGRFIFCDGVTNQFFVSDINSLVVNPLSFASAEGDPDRILALAISNSYLWLFNERTTEIWTYTGDIDFPYERVSGGIIEVGIAAASSLAKIKGRLFWLGREDSGQGVIYTAEGFVPRPISTKALEGAIAKYSDISSATAYSYSQGGHDFYVLNFAEMTWVYDLSSGMWHERAFTNAGNLERHRGQVHSFFPALGIHLIGDYASNKIYRFSETQYTDDGTEITRMRVSPHISATGKQLFCSLFELDMEAGVGNENPPGDDPQVMLTWSDDGGHTWSNESWTSAGGQVGGIGDFRKRVRWRRLGRFRQRTFKIKITDPVKVAILGANLQVEVGDS